MPQTANNLEDIFKVKALCGKDGNIEERIVDLKPTNNNLLFKDTYRYKYVVNSEVIIHDSFPEDNLQGKLCM